MKVLDKEDLQAIAQLLQPINDRLDSMDKRFSSIDERFSGIDERLSHVEAQLAEIKEDTETTRGAVNTLLEWADDASIQVVPLLHRKKPE
jgi:hypothetical protein